MVFAEALERQVERLRWVAEHPQRERLRFLDDVLRAGETFYWDADLLPVLHAGGSTVPADCRLDPPMLPAQAGFCWLATPLPVPSELVGGIVEADMEARGREGWALDAISWMPNAVPGRQADGTPEDVSTLMLFAWLVPPEGFESQWPSMPASLWWFFGDTLEENATTNRLEGRRPEDAASKRWGLAVFAAAMLFLHQGLAVAGPPARVDRHARKRLERAGWQPEPLVRVIRLRRVHTTPHDHHEPEDVAWACRWVVRGHWRQQWFPSVQQHRPLWIAPHVKGPEDKPIKAPRATVYAVVR
jgi:hypothetical protein